MAKIIYKEGREGQNKLSSIEGIEIGLFNGQRALIFPKYSEEKLLERDQISKWNAPNQTEIEALKVEDTNEKTGALAKIGSPAAEWVLHFWADSNSVFCLPSLLAALEIQYQRKTIDALAETIEGAELLRNFTANVWSCSRFDEDDGWFALGGLGRAFDNYLYAHYLAVPTILYREEEI